VTALFGVLVGCGGSGQAGLKPAPTAQQAQQLQNGARASGSGVTLTSAADVRTEGEDVRDEVTPVHIIVENRGNAPIRIKYSDFCLTTEDGKKFAALPPFELREMEAMPMAVARTGDRIEPKWKSEGFKVALAYAPLYKRGMTLKHGEVEPSDLPPETTEVPLEYDSAYYNGYYRSWSRADDDLPTHTMEQQALPEGILQPGGRLDGLMYFQNVPSRARRVVLREEVVNASTGQMIDTLELPFVPRSK